MTKTTGFKKLTFLLAIFALASSALFAPPVLAASETAPADKANAKLEASFPDLFAVPQANASEPGLATKDYNDYWRCVDRCYQRQANCHDACVDAPFGTGAICIFACETGLIGCGLTCELLY